MYPGGNPIKNSVIKRLNTDSLKFLDGGLLQLRKQTISYNLNWGNAPSRI